MALFLMQAKPAFSGDSSAHHRVALTLARVPEGKSCVISGIRDADAELTLLRFGLGIGDTLRVVAKVGAGGPVVLLAHDMEFALGATYANQIDVSLL
jgi:Fe2+ transport system protein FeoA